MEQRTRARQLRNDATDAERRLWQQLSARQMCGIRFNRQVPVGPFICDFVARSAKVIVEVDGGQHAWRNGQDAERTRYLEGLGFTVLRFWNNDVLERTDGVVEAIASVLARLPSPGPSRERKGNP
ncbi:endonuclease domain-containing protein [Sphingomonas sp. A2-49]|uniref:endonuclease domain-containing protein n=1 Tax=Sphingomonas sp. A2-49 TaxID=1391375 RepID=UPI0021D1742A|nr:endonuclease domain-containing protein [Sphingomonas sp. A2-49]MCU6453458.1 endonuclease domain-containing protein [Sphingomonas sp. A2-49]